MVPGGARDARTGRVGSGLIRTALLFCREAGYRRALLWTVSEMTAARRLYQAFGFRLAESVRRPLWGGMRTEERWDLDLRQAKGTPS